MLSAYSLTYMGNIITKLLLCFFSQLCWKYKVKLTC